MRCVPFVIIGHLGEASIICRGEGIRYGYVWESLGSAKECAFVPFFKKGLELKVGLGYVWYGTRDTL